MLSHLRYEIDHGVFDPKNYIKRELKALQFDHYIEAWMKTARKACGIRRHFSKLPPISADLYQQIPAVGFWATVRSIRDISEGHLENFILGIFFAALAGKTKANILGILHKVFSDALRRKDVGRIPIFPKVQVNDPQTKWIDEDEQYRILDEIADPTKRAFYLFLMKQGCRPGEARALRWENVKFKEGVVVICAAMDQEVYRQRTKEGDVRYLPLHPEVVEALKKLPRSLNGFVFTFRGKPLHRKVVWETWAKAAKRAGIDITCYQGTKHSLGSQAVKAGTDIEIVRRFFGHRDIRSTQRYVHVQTETLRSIWDRPHTVPKSMERKGKNAWNFQGHWN